MARSTVRLSSGASGDITTNTVEGCYSIFKRCMKGVYQHCPEKHRHRYLAEFDFRYSNRVGLGVNHQDRAGMAIKGMVGKRLTYRAAPPERRRPNEELSRKPLVANRERT